MLSPKAKAMFAKKKASVGKPTFSGSPMKRKGKSVPMPPVIEEAKEKQQ